MKKLPISTIFDINTNYRDMEAWFWFDVRQCCHGDCYRKQSYHDGNFIRLMALYRICANKVNTLTPRPSISIDILYKIINVMENYIKTIFIWRKKWWIPFVVKVYSLCYLMNQLVIMLCYVHIRAWISLTCLSQDTNDDVETHSPIDTSLFFNVQSVNHF